MAIPIPDAMLEKINGLTKLATYIIVRVGYSTKYGSVRKKYTKEKPDVIDENTFQLLLKHRTLT